MNRRKRLPRFSPLALTLLLFLSTPSNGQDGQEWLDSQYNKCAIEAAYVLSEARVQNKRARGRKIAAIDVYAAGGAGFIAAGVSLPGIRRALRWLAARVGVVTTGGTSIALYLYWIAVTTWVVHTLIIVNQYKIYDAREADLEKVREGVVGQCQADAEARYAGRVGFFDEAENSMKAAWRGVNRPQY